jgi:aspartyl-tRNA(Asn)/glutamyl-tRNA(Gln) amidotransferase subunit C
VITKEQVVHIAEIAKLSFDDSELDGFVEKFEQVVDFMQKINEAKADGVSPTYSVNEDDGFLKDGGENQTLTRDEVLMNTHETQYGYFKILKVVE